MWVVTRYQYRISALASQTGKPVVALQNVGCFLRLKMISFLVFVLFCFFCRFRALLDLQLDNKWLLTCLSRSWHCRMEKWCQFFPIFHQQKWSCVGQSGLSALCTKGCHWEHQRQKNCILWWHERKCWCDHPMYWLQNWIPAPSLKVSSRTFDAKLQVHL